MSEDKVSNGRHILRSEFQTKARRKQMEAKDRQTERQKRTAMQQYALLDSRLGKGAGARKERERLLRQAISEREFKLAQSRQHRIDSPATR